jgi:hypothetical protein
LKKYASGELLPWNKGLTKEDHPGLLKLSKSLTGELNPQTGKPAWNKGLTVDDSISVKKYVQSMTVTLREMVVNGTYSSWIEGLTKDTDPRVKRISDALKRAYLEGRLMPKSHTTRGGFRTDLGHHVRSSWEANFARLLRFLGRNYLYEAVWFELSNGLLFLPDFYVLDLEEFVEIKGVWYPDDFDRVECFRIDHPELSLRVIDETEYKRLYSKFKSIVPNWEYVL